MEHCGRASSGSPVAYHIIELDIKRVASSCHKGVNASKCNGFRGWFTAARFEKAYL
jgi:hypothetical protein